MLTLHRGPSTADLADALGELLATPPEDSFAKDVVVVAAKGVERWLAQRLSHRLGAGVRGADGVCAGIDFLRPRSLVALLTGTDRSDPWHPDRLAWVVLDAMDTGIDEPWAAPLARHLGTHLAGVERDLRQARRYGLAHRLARLFASYGVQRPALLTGWQAGNDTDLPSDLSWQPELWRRVTASIHAPPPDVRHAETCQALRERPEQFTLPARLSLFGHTRLPVTEVALLDALAAHRDVHLLLPQVSGGLWERLAPQVATGATLRASDDSARQAQHPLLATLGRDAREVQRQLAPLDAHEVALPGAPPEDHLLGWLQSDLRADTLPDAEQRATRVLAEDDDSLQLHACHGAVRQVEVLRDVLLARLENSDLEPRDILIMCPDVEAFAPLIEATFGAVPPDHPARQLRVSLADRGLAATNAVLAVAGQVLALVEGRARATDVLDLLATTPVRTRFAFTDDDLDTIGRWVADAGVRWGLDGAHRAPFGLTLANNTWRSGLDRVLAGVALPEEQTLLGRTLPLDDVGSSDIELAGRLAEVLARIEAAVADLADLDTTASTARSWSESLRHHITGLTATSYDEAWMQAQLDRELATLATSAESSAAASPISLADVRALLSDRIAPRPTRSNFRTGAITVSTLVPMRSVPHRVVCLLGMDADAFPRTITDDGDDALAREPRTGERDPRAEDRQLLLDAVMSARDALVITYAGMSEHSGQTKPPAIPISELVAALAATATGPVRSQVVVSQPLQPYSEKLLLTDRPITFDPNALAAALAARHPQATPPFLDGPLTPPPTELTIEDLKRFLTNPARALLNHLEVALPRDVDSPRNDIPINLGGLERWAVGDQIVRAVLGGADPQAVLAAEMSRGALPPGPLGAHELDRICKDAQQVVQQAMSRHEGEPVTTDVALELGGHLLTGRVPERYGDTLVRVTYSRLNGKQALALWLDLLAVQIAEPNASIEGVVCAKAGLGRIRPVDADLARTVLSRWVQIRHEGLQRLAHLPLETGRAWAKARRGGSADYKAKQKWQWDNFAPERDDPAWAYLLGSMAPLEALSGLGGLAEDVWSELLDFEKGWRW
ncbi:MAG: exodeoxyribonuclease V subunit gamma [Nocardioidaceae bacterium]|nr:exodeoxyribonuclease V subunit gamma [Nocardioidaceae bacterium]